MTVSEALSAPRDHRGGVLLLHGISRSPRSMRGLEAAARRAGYRTLNPGYASRARSLSRIADDLAPLVHGFAVASDGPLHIVTHSMGGLVARKLLARHPQSALGRIVMLAPPNQGSELADLLRGNLLYRAWFGPAGQELITSGDLLESQVPESAAGKIGVIAGSRSIYPLASLLLPQPNDGRVSVASTRVEGQADHITIPTSHPFIVTNRIAIAQTLAFMRDGRFVR